MKLKKVLRNKLSKSAYPSFFTKISEKELSMIAHAKRFRERYIADPAFRELASIDSRKAAKKYNINVDPETIRPLWDPVAGKKCAEQNLPLSVLSKLCLEYDQATTAWTSRHKSGETLTNPKFKAWWKRQIARNNSEIGVVLNSRIVHAPVCFELSSGCTVGCWFCAISADRFAGAFAYMPENQKLWKEVLEVVRDIAGSAAESGFCYWATDPFDNPDYEKFIKDYHAIIGALPGTNTAIAHKDLPRARSLIRMWLKYGYTSNHLSILTVKILDRIHQEFTAEELMFTGLNLVNKQSLVKKATAGRAREKIKKLSQKTEEYQEIIAELDQGTIACVSGFLFNMVEKKVKLITPCKASDRWPKGYKILAEGEFSSGADLRTLMEGMIENNMSPKMSSDQVVKFRADLEYKPLLHGFKLVSEHQAPKIENPCYGKEFGELIRKGTHTVDEIVETISKLGATRNEIEMSIDVLFKNGMLDD